jgi:hypothetical protein
MVATPDADSVDPGASEGSDDKDRIQITGDVVRRPAHAWTPTVHAFLHHLREAGLDCVPEPLSILGDVELVTWLPGVSGRDGWFAQHSSQGPASAARLLRRIHDASVGWVPPPGARWAGRPVPGADQVMCHGDPGPWNFVWDGGEAIGLIDWDFLHPGPREDDVAYALRWFAPARSDENALDWHHFLKVPDRPARIVCFLTAYGELPARDWVTAMADRVDATVRVATALAEQGIEPQRTWLAAGEIDLETTEAQWIRDHRHLLE